MLVIAHGTITRATKFIKKNNIPQIMTLREARESSFNLHRRTADPRRLIKDLIDTISARRNLRQNSPHDDKGQRYGRRGLPLVSAIYASL